MRVNLEKHGINEEDDEKATKYPIIITSEEAWEIIGNQLEVQEQLRTKGQQTLQLLIATVVIVAGASFALDYNISETRIREVASSLPTTASALAGTLLWNTLIMLFLLVISITVLTAFVLRNYAAFQHSALQPCLGSKENSHVLVTDDEEYLDFISGRNIRKEQFKAWIQTNNHKVSKKEIN